MAEFNKWTAIWGNAMSIADARPESYAKDITLRYPIYSPFDGDGVRLVFDNYTGTEPVVISKISVALESEVNSGVEKGIKLFGGEIDPETLVVVDGFEVPAGSKTITPPIPFEVKAGRKIVVSFHLKDFTLMRSGVLTTGPLSEAYFSMGDATETAILDPETTKATKWFYFLSDVDVHTEEKNHAVICYGDSITAQDWPDYLTLILKEKGITDTAIVRKAASGTRILREYSNITYNSYGLKGENRVPREFEVSGADAVIIQQGINDIIHPVGYEKNQFRPFSDLPTKDELIEGIDKYIAHAKDKGFQIYLGTLLPIYGWRTYELFREELKNAFNDDLRAHEGVDGVVDFCRALEDDVNPAAFADGYDSGDHLHPSKLAYRRMAEEAYKELFGDRA